MVEYLAGSDYARKTTSAFRRCFQKSRKNAQILPDGDESSFLAKNKPNYNNYEQSQEH